MDIQTIILGVILLIALVYLGRKLYRTSTGKGGCSGCKSSSSGGGCGSGCHPNEDAQGRKDLLK